jgi:hypothetical protein
VPSRLVPTVRRRRAVAPVVFLALLASVALTSVAAAPVAPAAVAAARTAAAAGLVPGALLSGPAYPSLFSASGATTEAFSSPATGDVTGDGQPDVVVGGMDGCAYIFPTGGGGPLGCLYTGAGPVEASPLLYDFDHDGTLDVLAANATTGDLFVFRGKTWQRLFHQTTDPSWWGAHGIFGTPAVGDLNHDGAIDIVATSIDTHVYAWRYTGAPNNAPLLFRTWVYDSMFSSPVIADIDRDGLPEIVFGADMDRYQGAPYPPGGLLWVLRHDGSVKPGWPRALPGQTIWSTPAVTDINGDGSPDIVVGTGLNFPAPAGKFVYALNSGGYALPGWSRGGTPGVPVNGAVMASPAVASVAGVGKVTVVAMEGGYITAINPDGSPRWTQCGASFGCGNGLPTHGSVSIADVYNEGRPTVVAALEMDLKTFDLETGQVRETQPLKFDASGHNDWQHRNFAPGSAPTIASIGGQAVIGVATTFDGNNNGARDAGDSLAVYLWKTGTPLGSAEWPTFKNNPCRTGTMVPCDTTPPTVPGVVAAASPSTVPTDVGWSSNDPGPNASGVASYDTFVSADNGPYAPWLARTTATSARLYGLAGHNYRVAVVARDRAGNVSGAGVTSLTFTSEAHGPFTAAYTTASNGGLGALGSVPLQGDAIAGRLARGIAVLRNGTGGYTVDAWGGVHPFGAAPRVATSAYWRGWDIVRGVAVNADGSGYTLDGFGGLHSFGGAAVPRAPYWRGWDIARGVALLPSSKKQSPAGYVLDAFGGVHPFGGAPAVSVSGYWRGWAIVRGIAVDPGGPGGYVLDAFGGVHPFGGAPAVSVSGYWRGWDIARGVALMAHRSGSPAGYTVDGKGGVHPFGTAPAVTGVGYWNADVVKGIALAP